MNHGLRSSAKCRSASEVARFSNTWRAWRNYTADSWFLLATSCHGSVAARLIKFRYIGRLRSGDIAFDYRIALIRQSQPT